jgi:hypothetical protein
MVPCTPAEPVDDGRRSDAYFGRDLAASVIAAGCLIRTENRGLPKLRARVGVEGIDAVVLGNDKNDILRLAPDREI